MCTKYDKRSCKSFRVYHAKVTYADKWKLTRSTKWACMNKKY